MDIGSAVLTWWTSPLGSLVSNFSPQRLAAVGQRWPNWIREIQYSNPLGDFTVARIVSGVVVASIGLVTILLLARSNKSNTPEAFVEGDSEIATSPQASLQHLISPQQESSGLVSPILIASSSVAASSGEEGIVEVVSEAWVQTEWTELKRLISEYRANPSTPRADQLDLIVSKAVEFARLAGQCYVDSSITTPNGFFIQPRVAKTLPKFVQKTPFLVEQMNVVELESMAQSFLQMSQRYSKDKDEWKSAWDAIANRAIAIANDGEIGNHAVGITKSIVLSSMKMDSVDAAIARLAPLVSDELKQLIEGDSDLIDAVKVVFATFSDRQGVDQTWLDFRAVMIEEIRVRVEQLNPTECIQMVELIQALGEEAQETWKGLLPTLCERLMSAIGEGNGEQIAFTARSMTEGNKAKVQWPKGFREELLDTLTILIPQAVKRMNFSDALDTANALVKYKPDTITDLRKQALRALGRRIGDLGGRKQSTRESYHASDCYWWSLVRLCDFSSDVVDLKEQLFIAYATETIASAGQMYQLQIVNAIENLASMKSEGFVGSHSPLMTEAIHALAGRLIHLGEWTMNIENYQTLLHPKNRGEYRYEIGHHYFIGIRVLQYLLSCGVQHPIISSLLLSWSERLERFQYMTEDSDHCRNWHQLASSLACGIARSDLSDDGMTNVLLLCGLIIPEKFAEFMSCEDIVCAAQKIYGYRYSPLMLRNATKLLAQRIAELNSANNVRLKDFPSAISLFAKSSLDQADKLEVINALASAAGKQVGEMTPKCAAEVAEVLVESKFESEEIRKAQIILAARGLSTKQRLQLMSTSPLKRVPNMVSLAL